MKKITGYKNYYITKDGDVIRNGRKLKHDTTNKDGYHRIVLCENAIKKRFLIHRLVALAYIDNPKKKKCVNHIDGNKNNNSISNLEWVTHKENMEHAYNNGLNRKRAVAKLDDGKVVEVFESIAEASRITGNTTGNIYKVCSGVGYTLKGFQWKFVEEVIL